MKLSEKMTKSVSETGDAAVAALSRCADVESLVGEVAALEARVVTLEDALTQARESERQSVERLERAEKALEEIRGHMSELAIDPLTGTTITCDRVDCTIQDYFSTSPQPPAPNPIAALTDLGRECACGGTGFVALGGNQSSETEKCPPCSSGEFDHSPAKKAEGAEDFTEHAEAIVDCCEHGKDGACVACVADGLKVASDIDVRELRRLLCVDCASLAIEAARKEEIEKCAKKLDELASYAEGTKVELESVKVWPAGHAYQVKFLSGWAQGLKEAAKSIRSRATAGEGKVKP